MTDFIRMGIALASGVLIGGIFFGGLWWTIQKGASIKRPALWFLGSLLLRMGITLGCFYFIAHGHWERLLVCLLGFLIGRFIVTRLTGGVEKPKILAQGVGDAPYS
jgi:F1F0 ATPase subunit 2